MASNKKSSSTNKSTSKRKTSKRKSSVKKGKVYIAPYKIIVLCAVIIIVCMILLLATTLATNTPAKTDKATITERFEKKSPAKVPEETENLKAPFDNSKKQQETTKSSKDSDIKKADESKKTTQKIEPKVSDKAKDEKKVEKTVEKEEKKTPAKPETAKKESTKPSPEKKSEPQKPAQVKPEPPAPSKPVETPTKIEKVPAEKETKTPVVTEKPAEKSKFNFPEAKNGAQLIFVFDDGGQNLNHLEKFFSLPFPFTVAVLPKLQYSSESAARIRKSGNEVILHQPMQSVNPKVNPGPGAIKPDMTEDQIKSLLFQNINEISPIVGLNNHEGSQITADAEKMAVVMQFSAEQGLYFLDSRTNVETKVPYVAKEMGYSYYERNIFLDNEKTRENTLKELNKGLVLANKNGSVIMIGHIWSADYLPALLVEAYPELKAKGYTFSVVSKSKAKK